jgi:type I restriction enzyme S subunit
MLKKYMLQKMFPKDGKCVPEIRFSGYTDDWEQCKLGEVLTLLKDGTHGTHKDSDYGPYLLSAKNIKNGQIIIDESSDRKISEAAHEQIHSSFKLQRGDVLLTIVGSIGESAILENTEGLTFQRSVAFLRPNNEMTSRFLRTEIEADKFQKELQDRKSQSAQPGVYLGELEKIPVVFPKIDEQKKIGAYFSSLDHLITLHQRKCDELKKMKKFMLQNMFV